LEALHNLSGETPAQRGDAMIYTFGYYGKDFDAFKSQVRHLGAMVIDIRLVPQSRFFPECRKANLEREFGEDYLHVKELGNKGFKENRIEIADMDTGMKIIDDLYFKSTYVGVRNLILICACKSYEKCHRKVVADELRDYAHEMQELPDV
jgi:uncharacterized protein (DUF488 family)